MKNVVFVPNIDLGNGRSDSYLYSVNSWKNWCEKNSCELLVWEDLLYPVDYMKITWQRYYLFDILEANQIEYNQILMVDADTIVHPNCPNFFDETKSKFGITINNGCYEWVTRSIKQWGNALFSNESKIKPWKYFNGGFQITNKKHIPFYTKVQEYYTSNIDKINKLSKQIQAGTDQTIINYLVQQNNINTIYLSESYNLQDLFRKNLLHIPGHSWFPDELRFLEAGWVYHFNAIPPNNRNVDYWMERTYKELYT